MPTYKYTVRDASGKLISDTKEANDRSSLLHELRQKNLYPISIEEAALRARPKIAWNFLPSSRRETVFFTRQLSNLLNSGVVLSKSLNLLADQSKTMQMRETITKIRDEVTGGGYLWEAIAKHPKTFSNLYISMIKAGEMGESLDKVLLNLAEHTERQRETQDSLIGMLVYPVILVLVGLATFIFLMAYVVPKMSFIFVDMEYSLPLITKILLALSAFLSHFWWALIALVLIAAVSLLRMYLQEDFRLKLDEVLFRLPVIGELIQKTIFVRFSQILGLLLSNGITIIQALEIAQGVIHNKFVAKQLSSVSSYVSHGDSLSSSLTKVDILSPLMVNMIAVGEETGRLDETLLKISQSYDKELQSETKRWLSLLEPSLILILALAVGLVVMAMLLPILQMNLQIV